MQIIRKISILLEMIKFEHTLFAMPFALMSAALASSGHLWQIATLWIILAMIGGRTAAMALNRVIDADIDKDNPRTAARAIPAGLVSRMEGIALAIFGFALLFIAVLNLPPLCMQLLPVAIVILVLYSYVKRWSWLAHLVLGVALGISTIGGWIAITGRIDLPAVILGVIVTLWVAGFDIIYACQDLDYDKSVGLHSIPVKVGYLNSLKISMAFHILVILGLVYLGILLQLGIFYWAGTILASGILFYEQNLVQKHGMQKVDVAFFSANGWISIELFVFTLLDVLL